MKVSKTALDGVLIVEPNLYGDARGRFLETWQQERYERSVTPARLVQDSASASGRGVIRGLHFQHPHPQGKLVSVLSGAVFDVAVDVRRGSPTFGKWLAEELSADSGRQLWIPPGFAHGFQALADATVVLYKCTDFYHPECERTILYSDPSLGIDWPVANPIVSARDAVGAQLAALDASHLPAFS